MMTQPRITGERSRLHGDSRGNTRAAAIAAAAHAAPPKNNRGFQTLTPDNFMFMIRLLPDKSGSRSPRNEREHHGSPRLPRVGRLPRAVARIPFVGRRLLARDL